MGMSASQMRYIMISGKKSDIELNNNQISYTNLFYENSY